MKRVLAAAAALAGALGSASAGAPAGSPALAHAPAGRYIEALYTLQQFLNESEVVAEGVIEKTDQANKTSIVRVTRALKGRCAYTHVRMNIGGGQEWHPGVVMRHLVEGAPVLVFYNAARQGEVYVNRFFCQLYGDAAAPPEKAWWNFTHIEIKCNRTFNGPVEELAKLLGEILSGKVKAPAADLKIPPISKEAVAALPAPGEPVDPAKLPAAFRRKASALQAKPREPDSVTLAVKGLAYQYYEGQWEALPDFGALAPVRTGTCEQFDLAKRGRDAAYGFRFTGFVEVPKDGIYTFTLSSNDGSKLYIGTTEVVDNDHFHGVTEASGEANLKAGKHALAVAYFQHAGQQVLEVSWEGPGLQRQKIPPAALFHAAGK
jgi:hypothetical protein